MFCVIASTGRTATSFVAECLNHMPQVVALHEGHWGNDQGVDVLPLVNLEHFHAYKNTQKAIDVVANKRSQEVVGSALARHGAKILIDVAYYNAVFMSHILAEHENSVGIGVIRDCESFVRSATWIHGDDPMPVGWPNPAKTLTSRERFIGMGRLRPFSGDAMEAWGQWGAIERNIWLWRETNTIILDAKEMLPDRVTLIDFSDVVRRPVDALTTILLACRYEVDGDALAILNNVVQHSMTHTNSRVGGYHIDERSAWTKQEQEYLMQAEDDIFSRLRNSP